MARSISSSRRLSVTASSMNLGLMDPHDEYRDRPLLGSLPSLCFLEENWRRRDTELDSLTFLAEEAESWDGFE